MNGLFELRPARPQDAEFLAWGIDEAAGGLFSKMYGSSSKAILASVVAQPGHQLSYQHAVCATVDGQLQGFYQGWPSGTPSADSELTRAAGLMAVRAAAVVLLAPLFFSGLGRHSPGEWYLQAIAVVPGARGGGVGHALLMDAIAKATAEGCNSVALDVDAANVRAQALYERMGFQVASTSRRALLLGGVRLHRMSVPLHSVRMDADERTH